MVQEETQDVATTEAKIRTKKVFTNEEIVALETTVEDISPILSENLQKVSKLVSAWYTDNKKDAIAEVVLDFGTETELKEYIKGDFVAELDQLNSIAEVAKILKSVHTVLSKEKAPKAERLKKGGKKITIDIDGKLCQINAEYFASLSADLTRDAKVELIQKHPSYALVVQDEVL